MLRNFSYLGILSTISVVALVYFALMIFFKAFTDIDYSIQRQFHEYEMASSFSPYLFNSLSIYFLSFAITSVLPPIISNKTRLEEEVF